MISSPDPGHPALPPDYEWVSADRWRIAVRRECRELLLDAGIGRPEMLLASGEGDYRGRGRPARVRLPGDRLAVLRRYLHGGAFGRIMGARFLGTPRSIRELLATDRARREGVRVPLILAAIHRKRGPFHEGYLLTEEIPDATNLEDALRAGGAAGKLLLKVGRETIRMHEAGVWHADLHVRNVLVSGGEVVLLDFDRARIMDPVPQALRDRNLLRFDRSLVKLKLAGTSVSFTDRCRLFTGHAGGGIGRERRNRLADRCRRSVSRHKLWWRFSR